ncbi:MAG: alpha-amylase/4-alpha-glucanotransferase domain-containing protein [Spirochaetaceae bacterium]
MKKIKLIFGTTNSQPVGASDEEVESVYQKSYKPFIRALYNAPHVRATLHYSGQLLQWLERRHSEFIDVLSELVGRKQVELLGGGFYEPIFPLIPRADRLGQIERLTTYLRKLFGKRPRGLWVTGQVWDPMLPSLLKTSGMEYTFLSDYQFDAGGMSAAPVHAPCITEDEGKMIIVFPISSELRKSCAEGSVDGIRRYLSEMATETEDRVVSLLCPGEWLEPEAEDGQGFDETLVRGLFALLDEESSWAMTATPSRYLKKATPRNRGYFPQAAFDPDYCGQESIAVHEVSDEARSDGYLPGTSFRSLLTRHAESNLMYAKMHYIHILVNQIRGDKYRKQLAREELWRGQCNSAYWAGGLGGGIYSNRLRKQIYSSLIEAEKVTREKGIFSPSIITVDFDMDGLSEFLYQGPELNAYVHKQGGVVFELDYLPSPWNYGDALSADIGTSVPAGRNRLPYTRNLFVDHFFDPDHGVSLASDSGSTSDGAELGDFVTRLYAVRQLSRDGYRIHFAALGHVHSGPASVPVEVQKEYAFDGGNLHVIYHVRNRGDEHLRVGFGSELNLSLGANTGEAARILAGSGSGATLSTQTADSIDGVNSVRVYDLARAVTMRLQYSDPAFLSVAPVYVGSGANAGCYQSSCLLPQWQLDLAVGGQWTQKLSLSLGGETTR